MLSSCLLMFCVWLLLPQEIPQSMLSRYDLGEKKPLQHKLPKRLSEASGLAVSADGRLFCHDDEVGIIYELDPRSGEIVKQFIVGAFMARGDFEGIAVKGDTMYLVTSDGTILEFNEGKHQSRVRYRVHRTPLSVRNDVEGLEYDAETDCLLLACKDEASVFRGNKKLDAYKAIYAFSLKTKQLMEQPRFLIPRKEVAKKAHRGNFRPSGIARHPESGTFFIISADGHSIIELGKDGAVLDQQEIPSKVNPQPEGIAFLPDHTLVICNDGQGGTGTMTLYPRVP